MFHKEAINAAMQWRYRPASIGGNNVSSQVKVTFNFNLKNSSVEEQCLTEQQKHKFEVTRQMAKEEMESLDKEISAELAKVKDKLLELQQAKKAVKQIYDGACARMGIKSVMEVTDLSLSDLVKQA